ncbi:type II toxin-antitoxin system RelE/ParE family toxin [Microbacterium halophytorum]|uniref:type II toxin-antitoxin system RelE/ParE family toxin n=1 Tax=Microbacterium halophytorum TaxID=2067568 RepID=UPI000CFBA0DD|nr:type II toxin-antitoxin system RelE/ParE family toxin [Microbacterium halophytorum]
MTARRVVTTRRADDDIDEAAKRYQLDGGIDDAMRYIEALEDVVRLISEFASIGSTRFATELGIDDLRAQALNRFPYLVFYTDDADAVRVHRVLHEKRDVPAELRS